MLTSDEESDYSEFEEIATGVDLDKSGGNHLGDR